jgi:hypothetical protein
MSKTTMLKPPGMRGSETGVEQEAERERKKEEKEVL